MLTIVTVRNVPFTLLTSVLVGEEVSFVTVIIDSIDGIKDYKFPENSLLVLDNGLLSEGNSWLPKLLGIRIPVVILGKGDHSSIPSLVFIENKFFNGVHNHILSLFIKYMIESRNEIRILQEGLKIKKSEIVSFQKSLKVIAQKNTTNLISLMAEIKGDK